MDAISYADACANLARAMDRVCSDHDPLIITRHGKPSVVMISLEDFRSIEETAHLLRSPRNTGSLLDAVASLEAGRIETQ